MIYKFKSQADADVIMLESNGDQMLSIIGRETSVRGIVTVAQIPADNSALEAAAITHEAAESRTAGQATMELEVGGDSARLRARTEPLVELLRNSARAGKDVVWGV
jgi:cyclopropane-fatty-acyl-phospholipid synthase